MTGSVDGSDLLLTAAFVMAAMGYTSWAPFWVILFLCFLVAVERMEQAGA
jgi:hypothetical protein